MEYRSHIIASVIFLLILGGGVVITYYWLSGARKTTHAVVIETQHAVSGISKGSPVKFKGQKVGHVASIGFAQNKPATVRIEIEVEPSVPLNRSSYSQLSSRGITGLSDFVIHTPDLSAQPLSSHADKAPHIPFHESLLDKVKAEGQADLKKFSKILDQVQNLTSGGNAQHISRTLAQLDQASHRLNQAEKQLQPVLQQLPGLMDQVNTTLASINKLTQQAVPALKQVGQAAQTADSLGHSGQEVMRKLNDRVLPDIDSLSQQLDETARQIQDLSKQLSRNPQSLLTGPPQRQPGPGEPGFNSSNP